MKTLDGNASLNLDDLVSVVIENQQLLAEVEKLKEKNDSLKRELLNENCAKGVHPFVMHETALLRAGITGEEIDEYLKELEEQFENESNS